MMARILLIDDEPNIRLLYSAMLNDRGHEVQEAASGRDALHYLEQGAVDLVLLDIKLGGESGLDLLQHIVRHYPQVPVILLTAYTSFQDDYTSWLAARYLVKEINPTTLLQEVERVLQEAQARRRVS